VAVFGLSLSTAATTSLRNQLIVTNILIGGSLALLFVLITLILVRNIITRPIAALSASAKQVAAGKLDVLAPSATNRDELGVLAESFNNMTAKLRQSMEDLRRRADEATTVSEVSRRLSTILNRKELVTEVVNQVKNAFNYYHAQIYFYDETKENLVMAGGTGKAGEMMLAQFHKIAKGRGLVGRAAETNAPVLVANVSQSIGWLANPLLPETKSEAAIPISIGKQVLGVLDVQHNVIGGLKQEDVDLLQSIANQIAIALQNVQQYDKHSRVKSASVTSTKSLPTQPCSWKTVSLPTAIRQQ